MHSDFSTKGRSAMESIPVPALPLDAIRLRSRRARVRGRVQIMAACAALSIGAIGAGVGAKIIDGVHVWLVGGKATSVVRSGVLLRKPMPADLRSAIAHATFPVIFPVGVPAGSRVNMVTVAPMKRPSEITIAYEGGRFHGVFALIDPAVIDGDAVPSDPALPAMRSVEHFRVGGEVVVVLAGSASPADLDRIKVAMAHSSPSESFGITATMLPQIMVLGGTVRLGAAEHARPPNGRSVLLDEQAVRSVAGLVRKAKPMYDWRITSIDKVTYKDGAMDKGVVVPKPAVVAISAGGIRAIDAVLRSRPDRYRCGCEMLFNQPSSTTYWVWTISMSGPERATRYAVDAKTFAVTPI